MSCADSLFGTADDDNDFEKLNSEYASHEKEVPKEIKFESALDESTLLFLAKLHNYSDIPRIIITSIIEDIQNFVEIKVEKLKESVISRLSSLGVDEKHIFSVIQEFDESKNPFSGLITEYHQLKQFQKKGTYVPPEKIELGQRDEYKNQVGVPSSILTHVTCTAEFIRIRFVLKNFFELPEVFDNTI